MVKYAVLLRCNIYVFIPLLFTIGLLDRAWANRAPFTAEQKFKIIVQSASPQTMTCYREALKENASLTGVKLKYRFVVRKNGKVRRLKLLENDFKGTQMEKCTRRIYKKLRFPKANNVFRKDYGFSYSFEPDLPASSDQ